MKKLPILFALLLLSVIVGTSCRYAPKEELGDTVAAKYFEPRDTMKEHLARLRKDSLMRIARMHMVDSTDIFVIGPGSTREMLQLLSYPSLRDTVAYGKGRHIKVKGSAEIGNIARIRFYRLPSGDSIVTVVQQVRPEEMKVEEIKSETRIK